MVFSSIPFLFFFLPISLIFYFIVPNKLKNYCLLFFSLIFYAWGEPIYILLMIFSSVVDYFNGILITKYKNNKRKKKIFLVASIVINLALLSIFKYGDFFISSINQIFSLSIPLTNLPLPIGISFFTFQTMSYSIDVYRGDVKCEKNFLYFMTYVSMFPQLIAGPIVRYETISKELHDREISFTKFSEGTIRFLHGLFKKVLIANILGYLWTVISSDIASASFTTSLLALFAFSFQIYFDFSGYSDMAIGIGKMLGFTYLENFNYPYISKSITEFWRRWHISLSTFFKDYVYIPLGGNRVSTLKNIRNIFVVWLLTGIWHGASWNFIIWGIYFGLLLLFEKFIFSNILKKLPSILQHLYAIIFILIGWTIFAFEDFSSMSSFIQNIFGKNGFFDTYSLFYLKNYFVTFLLAVFFSTPVYNKLTNYIKNTRFKSVFSILEFFSIIVLFFIVISLLVSDSYNPFLYFRF